MKLISRNVILVCTFIIAFVSCTSTREITEVKKRVVVPQVIKDSLDAYVDTSSHFEKEPSKVIIAKDIVKGDTTKWIEFIPSPELAKKIKELEGEKKLLGQRLSKIGKFKFEIKPDTIVLFDTLKRVEVIENIIETPFISKLGLVLIGIIICGVVIFVIRMRT